MSNYSFEFCTSSKIIFGRGKSNLLPELIRPLGSRIMIITGSSPQRHSVLIEKIKAAGIYVSLATVSGEPEVEKITEITSLILRQNCKAVLALGGGSVLDAGKAAAILANNPGDIMEYLEVVGEGKALPCASLPFIAVPTTAGTGSEVTRNSVITVPSHRVKVSLRSPEMLPKIALIDPELLRECPLTVRVNCSFDALCHLMEAMISRKATPFTDMICSYGLQQIRRETLQTYWNDPQIEEPRCAMAFASLLGGMALANGGLGAVHGFAGVIGGMFGAPHGAVCAALLAPVLKTNMAVARQIEEGNSSEGDLLLAEKMLKQIEKMTDFFTAGQCREPEKLITELERLTRENHVPRLSDMGIKESDLPIIIKKSSQSSSMKGNPFSLSEERLSYILHKAL